MDDLVRTNPTANVTLQDYLAVATPHTPLSVDGRDSDSAVQEVEQRGYELARRLGVESKSGRLPAYIWAIVFRHGQ